MEDVARDAAGEPDATDVVQRAHKTMDKIERLAGVTRQNSPDQHVHVGDRSPDKVLVWILIAASAVILGVNIGKGEQISVLQRKVDRLEDYQTTTYILVPKLRELVDEQIARKQEKK